MIRNALMLLTLPGVLAHEMTHAVVVAPWARRLAVVFDIGGGAHVAVDYRRTPPQWAVVAAHYAPLAAGVVAASAAAWLILSGRVALPSTTTDIALWTIALAWWLILVAPSPEDRDTEVDA